MEIEKLDELAEEFNETLKDKCVCWWVNALDEETLECEIYWGDWKHDHLYFEYLIKEFLKSKGIGIRNMTDVVTEENQTDCYSAVHYVTVIG